MHVRLLLPTTALAILVAPATAAATLVHTVAPGESLYSIAAADGLTASQLAAANGLAPDAQLTAGSTVTIPPQGGEMPAAGAPSPTTPSAAPAARDSDSDGANSVSRATEVAVPVSATTAVSSGSYAVQPGDSLSAIAARAGTSVTQVAAANGIDPGAPLPAGIVLTVPQPRVTSPAPTQAPAVGTTIVGRMTWFGGPRDPEAQGIPASGLGWRADGMSVYNYGSLGHHWLIHFPWGQTLDMSQIDVGPAPWTGNVFDMAFSALPNTPYNTQNWPNPIVTGIYQGS